MDPRHVSGQPVQIVKINDDPDDHSFFLDEAALNRILLQDNGALKDKPLCIVSVAGAFRRGKSFLLDFLLRYLCAADRHHWLGPEDSPLEGFHWRGGSERDTTGILMWSKIFLIPTGPPGSPEVAVVLMDTQGAFDTSSTVRDCATIFALSAMLSSVLVYNLTANIQEDDLQHLELFTEYGRLAIEDSGETPFQKLQFLVRDWSYPYEAQYGAEGGRNLVQRRLELSDKQHSELQDLRKNIRSCFSSIEGFLLPHPGLKVATDPGFEGRLKDIEPMFIQHLQDFVPLLLAPENIVIKKINGNVVKCKELVQFFRAYIEIFKGDEMPEPKSMLKATSEANNLASLQEAKETYVAMMESICGGDKPYLNEQVLDIEHCRIKDQAVLVFSSRRKMGGEEFSLTYREKLEREIDESYANYKAHNESKNIFKAANTPITLAAVAMLLYILSQFFTLLGITPVSGIFNLALTGTFLLLATWCYVKYTGNATDIGSNIDHLAATIWDSGIQPVFSRLAQEGSQFATKKALERMNSQAPSPQMSPAMSKKRS
ncbi:hypothetical protein TCAL_09587 [Tigriopus californicus]|uniref:GB1/RHD3-type G domain-containing protein n=1 Tax=Tigriopus californicus TaxID=6832 RepID=A0A553PGT9_TIGCA|nr:atlastin-like [Tigriopus californicus]TRY76895.1 hypothetical protein TCAL_09587 [Tigriopus californicus]|eukprot:TCALIF_09587-PA protein Name:"Similar to atl Atlastin (Drosophila melanogaster)" AED:0.01 eAED:0.01 QI:896/1/1/1/0.33/0.25/4/260/543